MPNNDKSLHYMLETLNILIENQKILSKRINNLESKLKDLCLAIVGDRLDDEDSDRTIN
tara:strand:- start:330 stop:506 length:177 start_codon:yes stop_codon:yes gene_type:complete